MKSQNFKAVGERIREVRKQAGLTLVEFSKVVGSDHSYLSRVENGKQRPSHGLITAIRDNFNVGVGWLYEGVGTEMSEPVGVDYKSKNVTDQSYVETGKTLKEKARVVSECGKLLLQAGSAEPVAKKLFGYAGLTGTRVRLAAANDDALTASRLLEIVTDNDLWFAAGEPDGWEFELLRGYFDFGGDRTLEQWMECLRMLRWERECLSTAQMDAEHDEDDGIRSA